MAEAFRNGNLGIMDYYKMKNIEADTSMREAIAKPSNAPSKPLKRLTRIYDFRFMIYHQHINHKSEIINLKS